MEYMTNELTALAPSTMRLRREFGRDLKEKLCYITSVYDTELKIDYGKFRRKADPHALGRKHHLCRHRPFPLHECFFQPISLALQPAESTTFLFTISRSVTLTSAKLYVHVMLPGGTTMSQEIGERMTKELTCLAPSTMKAKVVAPPE